MTVEEQLADMIARRTRGGTPPPCDQSWANLVVTPPPPSAADDTLALPDRFRTSRDGGHL